MLLVVIVVVCASRQHSPSLLCFVRTQKWCSGLFSALDGGTPPKNRSKSVVSTKGLSRIEQSTTLLLYFNKVENLVELTKT